MNEECLICKAPLEYLDTDEVMECVNGIQFSVVVLWER